MTAKDFWVEYFSPVGEYGAYGGYSPIDKLETEEEKWAAVADDVMADYSPDLDDLMVRGEFPPSVARRINSIYDAIKAKYGIKETTDPIEQAIDMVLSERVSGGTRLKRALPSNAKIIPISKWSQDDVIERLLADDGIPVERDGEFLKVWDDSYIGYADVDGIVFQIATNWIPLWQAKEWEDFQRLADPGTLYAISAEDYMDRQEDLETAIEDMGAAGFEVGSFEGF